MFFIGLLYFKGLLKYKSRSLEDFWSRDLGNKFLRENKPLNRFKCLATYLRFNESNSKAEQRKNDKLALNHVILDTFIKICNLFSHCTIDGQVVSFRGRRRFRVSIKSKPDKFGTKTVMMNDLKAAYISMLSVRGKV